MPQYHHTPDPSHRPHATIAVRPRPPCNSAPLGLPNSAKRKTTTWKQLSLHGIFGASSSACVSAPRERACATKRDLSTQGRSLSRHGILRATSSAGVFAPREHSHWSPFCLAAVFSNFTAGGTALHYFGSVSPTNLDQWKRKLSSQGTSGTSSSIRAFAPREYAVATFWPLRLRVGWRLKHTWRLALREFVCVPHKAL